jgi:hypothetical protein
MLAVSTWCLWSLRHSKFQCSALIRAILKWLNLQSREEGTVPGLRALVAGLSWPRFDPRFILCETCCGQVVLRQVFLQVIRIFLVLSFCQCCMRVHLFIKRNMITYQLTTSLSSISRKKEQVDWPSSWLLIFLPIPNPLKRVNREFY